MRMEDGWEWASCEIKGTSTRQGFVGVHCLHSIHVLPDCIPQSTITARYSNACLSCQQLLGVTAN